MAAAVACGKVKWDCLLPLVGRICRNRIRRKVLSGGGAGGARTCIGGLPVSRSPWNGDRCVGVTSRSGSVCNEGSTIVMPRGGSSEPVRDGAATSAAQPAGSSGSARSGGSAFGIGMPGQATGSLLGSCARGFATEARDPGSSVPLSGRRSAGRGECFKESQQIGTTVINFETGKMARLTSGAVLVGMSDTKVLATAVCERDMDPSKDFLPLTVDYREKHFAKGKIPSTFLRREGAPKEREILSSRSIDRSLRPLFPPGFKYEVQIMANVLCSDGDQDPDVLSINAASAALMVSDIPWNGPVGAVRIGRVNGTLIVNPDVALFSESDLSLVYVCSEGKTMMVEVQAREISNEDLITAMRLAHSEATKLLEPQRKLAAQANYNDHKRKVQLASLDDDFYDRVRVLAEPGVVEVLRDGTYGKQERGAALSKLHDDVAATLIAEGEERGASQLSLAMTKVKKEVTRRAVFDDGVRCDGRGPQDVREIYCEAGPLSSLHGSALFSRGNTEALCTVTIGAPEDAQRLDSLVGPPRKRFMVHYSFPPFAVNEVGKSGHLNRREIGHGNLAEKALLPLLPPEEGFPFSVRINSEVLASDGSSSMATVCGGSVALMDAGVNLREHVAGVSIGLVTDLDEHTGEISRYQLLTDILGVEDYLGDMDFKIAGTRKGVTAVQLDIKLPGVPLDILCEALEAAQVARATILDRMEEEITSPRLGHRDSAPRYGTINVDRDYIGKLIGPQGVNVRGIQDKTGARINISSEGKVEIFAKDQATFDAAKDMLDATCGREIEVGGKYSVTVVAMKDFGAFVELPGGFQGLLHISELAHHRVASVQDVLSVGQIIDVMCTARDLRGNMKFSLKALLPLPEPSEAVAESTPSPRMPESPRSPTAFRNPFRPPPGAPVTPPSPAPEIPAVASVERESWRQRTGDASNSSHSATSATVSMRSTATATATPKSIRTASNSVEEERRQAEASVDRLGLDSGSASSLRTAVGTSGRQPMPRPGESDGESRTNPPATTATGDGSGTKQTKGTRKGGMNFKAEKKQESADVKVTAKGSDASTTPACDGVKLGHEYGVRIKKLKKFGALVETKEGLEGLVRFEKANLPSESFEVGEEVLAVCAEAGGPGRPKFSLKST